MMDGLKKFFKSNKKDNTEQQQSGQTPDTTHPSQRQIYVLPYPSPPYYGNAYPQPNQRQQDFQQSSQPTVQHDPSVRPIQRTYSQPSPDEQRAPQQGQQPVSGSKPAQPPPPPPYVYRYPLQPPSAKDAAMVRPGRRLRQSDEPEDWSGFEDKKIRASFIRKVYIILMLQLLFTMAIIALFVFEPNVKQFVQENLYLFYISLVIFVVLYLSLACFQSVRRKFPVNLIVLCLFTLAMSYFLGTVSSVYNTEGVFMAVGICAAVCLAVSLFSFYSKFDFTSCGGILCILFLILIGFGLIAIFLPSKVMTMIYAATGAIVFSLFLAYDTQMMMGGKNYELSPEEYIFAAVQLYLDIVYIFMFLLMLFGETN